MWHELKTTPPEPTDKPQQLLVAYALTTKPGQFDFDVLIFWPDGVWTDLLEDQIETDCMPTYWRTIESPIMCNQDFLSQALNEGSGVYIP